MNCWPTFPETMSIYDGLGKAENRIGYRHSQHKTELVSASFSQISYIPKDEERCFHAGYYSYCESLLEAPKYPLQNLYRALSVTTEESGFLPFEGWHASPPQFHSSKELEWYYHISEIEKGVHLSIKVSVKFPAPLIN